MPAAMTAPAVVAPAWLSRPDHFFDDQLQQVRADRPHDADDQRHDRISGRARDHRVGFPQAEAGQRDQEAERKDGHPEAEQQDDRQVQHQALLAVVLRKKRQEDEGD